MKTRILSLLLALCLIVGVLPFAAFAEDTGATEATETTETAPFVSVKLVRYVENLIEGTVGHEMTVAAGETKYATTSAEGVPAEATEEDAWNIKVDFPAGGKPTITLSGATLKGGQNEAGMYIEANVDLTINVEVDSEISSMNRAAISVDNLGLTTITGAGKLTITTKDASGISATNLKSFDYSEMLFKDADIELNVNGESTIRQAIYFTGKDMVIDHSTITINGSGSSMGIWGYATVTKDENGNITKIAGHWSKPADGEDFVRNLTIQNGSVITGTVTTRQAFGASGNVTIKGSTVEISSAAPNSSFGIFDKPPVLEGEYTAVSSSKQDGKKVEFKSSKATTIKYFNLVPEKVDLSELGVETTPPTTVPETQPETKPEATTPEATKPEATKPEATTPEATKPEATKPEATTPEATTPEATKPEATTPEATKPEATKPEATKPEATTPEATKPEATTPEATKPEATKPEATTPEATKPEATTPEATTPETQPIADDDTNNGPNYTLVAILVCGAALVAVVVAVVVVMNSKKKAK